MPRRRKEWPLVLDLAIAFRQLSATDAAQAYAHYAEAVALGRLNRPEEAIAAYDEVVRRFGFGFAASAEPALSEQVAKAQYNRACIFGKQAKAKEAVDALTAIKAAKSSVDCAQIIGDANFEPIRSDPLFVAFMTRNGCIG